jgi:hypothetical protein
LPLLYVDGPIFQRNCRDLSEPVAADPAQVFIATQFRFL